MKTKYTVPSQQNEETEEEARLLEKALSKLSYGEITKRLEPIRTEVLYILMESRSIKVGDVASYFLGKRVQIENIVKMVLEGKFRTRNGKVRATNMMQGKGRRLPDALPAYLTLIKDRNPDVAGNALWGLVFSGYKTSLPAIRELSKTAKEGSRLQKKALLAIEAIELGDPYRFSPGFRDAAGVWK